MRHWKGHPALRRGCKGRSLSRGLREGGRLKPFAETSRARDIGRSVDSAAASTLAVAVTIPLESGKKVRGAEVKRVSSSREFPRASANRDSSGSRTRAGDAFAACDAQLRIQLLALGTVLALPFFIPSRLRDETRWGRELRKLPDPTRGSAINVGIKCPLGPLALDATLFRFSAGLKRGGMRLSVRCEREIEHGRRCGWAEAPT